MLLPWHMGALHPVEQALTALLAFGPFVVLAIVVLVRRRHEDAEEPPADPGADPQVGPADGQRER
ncbi:hypothetical protein [Nocardioides dongkuii]|uniref:hypothetical protein n=1 Tax=Nocardioides dongkuii TaxID=2760089 RepID=UPI0015FCF73A|nr:hypothetical protein [Nocardioides dongkuii]